MPDSVARTITPTVTSRNVATTVASAVFWKRVTGGGSSLRGSDASRNRDGRGAGDFRHSSLARPGRPRGARAASEASPGDSGYAPPMRRRPHRSAVSPVLAVALAAMVAVLAACSLGSGATPVPTAPAGASGSPAASGPSVIPVIIGSHEAG